MILRLRLCYDAAPAPVETGSPMLDAMNEAEAAAATPAPEAKPAEGSDKPKFAWGNEDRRKERYAPKDEDEIELGYDDEKDGVKTPAKRSLKDIRETAKWLKENDQLIRSSVDMRNMFTKNPDLHKAFSTLITKSHEGGKYNPEAVAKMALALEGKAEVIADKIDDNADDIAEAEKELLELDHDSPQYKVAKRSLNSMKTLRAQLAESNKANKDLQEKLGGFDKFKTGLEETQVKQKEEADVKQATELFDSTFGALSSSSEYKMEDADDAKEFEGSVRDGVATLAQQGKINNDAEYTKAIQDSAKVALDKINKRNERTINSYLKKKGQLPTEKEKPKEEKIVPSADDESIGDAVLRELNKK